MIPKGKHPSKASTVVGRNSNSFSFSFSSKKTLPKHTTQVILSNPSLSLESSLKPKNKAISFIKPSHPKIFSKKLLIIPEQSKFSQEILRKRRLWIKRIIIERKMKPYHRHLIKMVSGSRIILPSDSLRKKEDVVKLRQTLQNLKLASAVSITHILGDNTNERSLLRHLPYITTLEIKLKKRIRREYSDAQRLSLGLKHSRLLSNLGICFGENSTRILDGEFQTLFSGVSRLKKISVMQVAIHDADRAINSRILSLFHNLKSLKSITTIHIGLNCYEKLYHTGIVNLASGLKQYICLSDLTIGLSRCSKITTLGLQYLASSLSSHLFLTVLDLNLSHTKLDPTAVTSLMEGLERIPHLSDLTLNFSSCFQTAEAELTNLWTGLSKLTMLSRLNLNLLSCINVNNDDMEALSSALGCMTHLYSLTLNFNHCTNIHDIGIDSLSRHLARLNLLSNLSLSFLYCYSITDNSTKDLERRLGHLTSLDLLC